MNDSSPAVAPPLPEEVVDIIVSHSIVPTGFLKKGHTYLAQLAQAGSSWYPSVRRELYKRIEPEDYTTILLLLRSLRANDRLGSMIEEFRVSDMMISYVESDEKKGTELVGNLIGEILCLVPNLKSLSLCGSRFIDFNTSIHATLRATPPLLPKLDHLGFSFPKSSAPIDSIISILVTPPNIATYHIDLVSLSSAKLPTTARKDINPNKKLKGLTLSTLGMALQITNGTIFEFTSLAGWEYFDILIESQRPTPLLSMKSFFTAGGPTLKTSCLFCEINVDIAPLLQKLVVLEELTLHEISFKTPNLLFHIPSVKNLSLVSTGRLFTALELYSNSPTPVSLQYLINLRFSSFLHSSIAIHQLPPIDSLYLGECETRGIARVLESLNHEIMDKSKPRAGSGMSNSKLKKLSLSVKSFDQNDIDKITERCKELKIEFIWSPPPPFDPEFAAMEAEFILEMQREAEEEMMMSWSDDDFGDF